MTTQDKTTQKERPLSPHLQIYNLPMTARMSILHRLSGAVLAAGTLLICWLLIAAAIGPESYETAMNFFDSALGRIILFGWSAVLFYHLCNGVRHLLWDAGYLFELKNARISGYIVLTAAVILTVSTWYCALNF